MKLTEKQRDWLYVVKLWVRVNSYFPPSAMIIWYMDSYVHQCFRQSLKEYDDALAAYKDKYHKK